MVTTEGISPRIGDYGMVKVSAQQSIPIKIIQVEGGKYYGQLLTDPLAVMTFNKSSFEPRWCGKDTVFLEKKIQIFQKLPAGIGKPRINPDLDFYRPISK